MTRQKWCIVQLSMMQIKKNVTMIGEFRSEKYNQTMTGISMLLGIFLVLFLAVTREAYAVVVAFLLLVIKGILLLKYSKR